MTRPAPIAALAALQAFSDGLAILVGFVAASVAVPYLYPGLLIPGVIFGTAFVFRAAATDLYDWPTLPVDVLVVERLLRASLWALLPAGLGVVVLRAPGPSRVALLAGWLVATGIVVVKRWSFARWSSRIVAGHEIRVLIVSPQQTADRLERHFSRLSLVRFTRLGLGEGWDPAHGDLGDLKRAECDEIWVPASVAVARPALLSLEGARRPVRLLWDLWGVWGVHLETAAPRGWPLARPDGGAASTISRAVKRVFDLAFASTVLVLSAPVVAVVAAAIKLDSKGPVFFRQTRAGRAGREFRMLKFRTMYVEASDYATKPSKRGDPRITRVGKFLRQTGLDELPQIVNVVRGEMSFVGPRPEMPYKVAEYTPLERLRLGAVPGITGLWQVNVHRSHDIREAIEYDFYYLFHRSLLLDLLIIAATVVEIVKGLWGRSIFDV